MPIAGEFALSISILLASCGHRQSGQDAVKGALGDRLSDLTEVD
jgi:hypothetical protein